MSLVRINPRPSPRQLLVFAVAWVLLAGWLGWTQESKGRTTAALACWALAAVAPLAGLLWREGLRWLYVGLSYLTYPIGLVISSAVLVLFYYGVLTPIGLVLRVCGYDPLQQRATSRTTSYWRARPGPRRPADYFRQH